jgi:hypothetical protein
MFLRRDIRPQSLQVRPEDLLLDQPVDLGELFGGELSLPNVRPLVKPHYSSSKGAAAPVEAWQAEQTGIIPSHRRRGEVRSAVSELGPDRLDVALDLVVAGGGATAWISKVASVRLVPGTGAMVSRPAARSEASPRRRVGGETSRAASRSRYRKVSPEGDSSRRASRVRRSPKASRPRIRVQARQWVSR